MDANAATKWFEKSINNVNFDFEDCWLTKAKWFKFGLAMGGARSVTLHDISENEFEFHVEGKESALGGLAKYIIEDRMWRVVQVDYFMPLPD